MTIERKENSKTTTKTKNLRLTKCYRLKIKANKHKH